jgi:hypothetical protein
MKRRPFLAIVQKRPCRDCEAATKSKLRPLTAMTGLDCSLNVNSNINCLSAMLPALLGNGLSDYFISSDISHGYLYWK